MYERASIVRHNSVSYQGIQRGTKKGEGLLTKINKARRADWRGGHKGMGLNGIFMQL